MVYIIVTEQDRSTFIHRVNERISEGYIPQGGPFITTHSPGYGYVHALPPDCHNSFIYTEFNQAMIHTSLETA
jgi:hypothetical protein